MCIRHARRYCALENLIAEVDSEEALLADVEAALERLQLGTYGSCFPSQQPIPLPRLRAFPWTQFRREAATSLEK
ncbi:MAG: hypothetical protein EXS40_05720 [Opitutaceae bacterium]|nr:hypothetical protein [Opitutaceae bacterium]